MGWERLGLRMPSLDDEILDAATNEAKLVPASLSGDPKQTTEQQKEEAAAAAREELISSKIRDMIASIEAGPLDADDKARLIAQLHAALSDAKSAGFSAASLGTLAAVAREVSNDVAAEEFQENIEDMDRWVEAAYEEEYQEEQAENWSTPNEWQSWAQDNGWEFNDGPPPAIAAAESEPDVLAADDSARDANPFNLPVDALAGLCSVKDTLKAAGAGDVADASQDEKTTPLANLSVDSKGWAPSIA